MMTQQEIVKLRTNLFVYPIIIMVTIPIFFALIKDDLAASNIEAQKTEENINTNIPTTSSKIGTNLSEAEQFKNRYNGQSNSLNDYGTFLANLEAKEQEKLQQKEEDQERARLQNQKDEQLLSQLNTSSSPVAAPRPQTTKASEDERAKKLAEEILKAREEQQKGKNEEKQAPVQAVEEIAELLPAVKSKPRFFSSTSSNISNKVEIKAEILPQTIKNGSSIALLLMEDSYSDDGFIIPKGTTVYAVSAFSRNRVMLRIESVRLNNKILKYKKVIYDLDSMEGLAIPDNIRAEFNKSLTDQSIDQSTDVLKSTTKESSSNLVVSSVSGVASMTKNILKKANNEVPVPIQTNYKVLLR